MYKPLLELCIVSVILVITWHLLRHRPLIRPRHAGYDLLLAGFVLLAIAAVLDFLNLDTRPGILTPLQDVFLFIELGPAYLLGAILAGIGLSLWLPSLIRYQQTEAARQQAEQRLHDSERNLRLHIHNTPLGVIEWDESLRVLDWNPAAQRIFGYTREEALGQGIDLVMPAEEETELSRMLSRVAAEESVIEGRHLCRHRDGTEIVCDWYCTRLVDTQGRHLGYASLVQDVTREVRTQAALQQEKNLLAGLLDVAPGPFYMVDTDGNYVRWNRAMEQLTGYSHAEFARLNVRDLVVPEEWDEVAQRIGEVFATGRSTAELTIRTRGGERRTLFATGARVEMDDQVYLAGLAVDISARKQTERALMESKQALEDRNEALQLVNRLSDRLHRSLEVEAVAQEAVEVLVGHSRPPLVAFYLLDADGKQLRLIAHHGFDKATLELGATLPVRGSLSGLGLLQGDLVVCPDLKADQRLEPRLKANLVEMGIQSALLIPLHYQEEPLGTINLVYPEPRAFTAVEMETFRMMGQAISLAIANTRHLAGLDYQAHHDALTGLPNRIMLHQVFDRHIGEIKAQGHIVALVLLDLNGFKEINDTLGHPMGDRLLKGIGPHLHEALEGYNSLVCRLGGDEFAVLLLDLDDEDQAMALTQNVMCALKQPLELGQMKLEIGSSIGVALYPRHGSNSHALLRCADVAMYQAKVSGAGVLAYDSQHDKYAPERIAMLADLAPAIRADQLVLHYQPKVDLRTRQVVGFEALVRWEHPELGLILPDTFIPLAELSDAIHALTYWVVDRALKQLRTWNQAGLQFTMAINLSARNLLDTGCSERLRSLITRYGVDPTRIEFELTETALMHDARHVEEHLAQIAATGACLSVDDFGTGYSSLSYLKRFPIHTLKIDRSFVVDMLSNEQSAAIVRSTIDLARSLGIGVVAEGVEDAATLEALQRQGCGIAQGYFIARPMPAQVLDRWLEESEWSAAPGTA